MHEATWSREDAVAVLESPERKRTQDPGKLWNRVGLRPGDVIVDVGAGSGFYSFPAADRVGKDGHVFAVDVSEELVELIRERAEAMHVGNVEPLLSGPAHIPLDDAVADVALLANVLHGIPPGTVEETIRVLRPGGRLVDVDWKKEATPEGPPVPHRLSAAEATRVLSDHGLTPVRSFELGPYHYVLILERPRPLRRPGHLVSSE
jgi:ubiquinone/menaquinone biosynthesis C-methylase UbiE